MAHSEGNQGCDIRYCHRIIRDVVRYSLGPLKVWVSSTASYFTAKNMEYSLEIHGFSWKQQFWCRLQCQRVRLSRWLAPSITVLSAWLSGNHLSGIQKHKKPCVDSAEGKWPVLSHHFHSCTVPFHVISPPIHQYRCLSSSFTRLLYHQVTSTFILPFVLLELLFLS